MEKAKVSKRIFSILLDAIITYVIFLVILITNKNLKDVFEYTFMFCLLYQFTCYLVFKKTIGDSFLNLRMIFAKERFYNIFLLILHSFAKSIIIVPIDFSRAVIPWGIRFILVSLFLQTIPKFKRQFVWDLPNILIINEKNVSINQNIGESSSLSLSPPESLNRIILLFIHYIYQVCMLIFVLFFKNIGISNEVHIQNIIRSTFWIISFILFFLIMCILFKKINNISRDKTYTLSVVISGIPTIFGFVLFIYGGQRLDFFALFTLSNLYTVLSSLLFFTSCRTLKNQSRQK
ncbi:MAG: hypothetical protein GX075_03940 [Firmicutes bacterium]|nr:hypothetical protein [Bacillota bacterium]